MPLYLRLGLCRYCQPIDGERFLALLRQVAERGLLHSLALATAGETLRALPSPRLPIADLDGMVERLGQHSDPALRYLSLVLLSAIAAPENGQRYTPARRARLAIATHAPAPLVASFAQFCFPLTKNRKPPHQPRPARSAWPLMVQRDSC